jgi:hypothetical protein
MVISPKDYVLERKFSMGATGIAFDFESTSLLISDQANQEEDELQTMWEEEQEKRRKFDQQRASELRSAAVDSNMRKVLTRSGPKPWNPNHKTRAATCARYQPDPDLNPGARTTKRGQRHAQPRFHPACGTCMFRTH